MEVENNKVEGEVDDSGDDVRLPGFRFHPTDEELLGFYLRRKVEKRSLGIDLIKHADIYKYDPWDLPRSGNVGDKEFYFFCKRGRKYKNSVRPNRVTGSGFWKATGIDKPIYEGNGGCIGLKKSLVYYRGCAGKGSKTDWMMHEFRLPPPGYDKSTKRVVVSTKSAACTQEAEIWTLCRILKRSVSYRKSCLPGWRELRGKMVNPISDAGSKTCSMDSSHHRDNIYDIYNFNPQTILSHANPECGFPGQHLIGSPVLITSQASSASMANSAFTNGDMINDLLRQTEYWEDDLRSIVNSCDVEGTIENPFYL